MHTTWRYDPTTLRLFIATCEEGSFAKAAERESVGASAVSKRIAELEEAVGSSLLYRRNKGVQPTPAGQCLLEHAQRLLNEMLKMSADLSQFTSGEKGHVRTAHPYVEVELEERTSEQVIENILGNQCDIGIGAGLESASEVGLAVQNYHMDHLALVVRGDHPLASRASVDFAESLGYRHIALHRDSPLYQTLDKAACAVQRPINYGVHLQSFDAVCRMIQSGLGVAVLPDRAISETSEDLPLITIPLNDAWANRQFHVVSQPRDKRSATTQSFLDFVESVA